MYYDDVNIIRRCYQIALKNKNTHTHNLVSQHTINSDAVLAPNREYDLLEQKLFVNVICKKDIVKER